MEGEEADVDRAAALTIRLLGGREQVEESTARTVAALNSKPGAVLRSGESRGLHARRIGWGARRLPGRGTDRAAPTGSATRWT